MVPFSSHRKTTRWWGSCRSILVSGRRSTFIGARQLRPPPACSSNRSSRWPRKTQPQYLVVLRDRLEQCIRANHLAPRQSGILEKSVLQAADTRHRRCLAILRSFPVGMQARHLGVRTMKPQCSRRRSRLRSFSGTFSKAGLVLSRTRRLVLEPLEERMLLDALGLVPDRSFFDDQFDLAQSNHLIAISFCCGRNQVCWANYPVR